MLEILIKSPLESILGTFKVIIHIEYLWCNICGKGVGEREVVGVIARVINS